MQSRHERNALVFLPRSAKSCDRDLAIEEQTGGRLTEGHDDLGCDCADLSVQEGAAGTDLRRQWIPVSRRAAFNDVADVDLAARDPDAFLDHLGEKFPRAADKGEAAQIFLLARAFTNEHQVRVGIAVAEDDRLPTLTKVTAGAIAEMGLYFIERRPNAHG
jgi:hypothetical protein